MAQNTSQLINVINRSDGIAIVEMNNKPVNVLHYDFMVQLTGVLRQLNGSCTGLILTKVFIIFTFVTLIVFNCINVITFQSANIFCAVPMLTNLIGTKFMIILKHFKIYGLVFMTFLYPQLQPLM